MLCPQTFQPQWERGYHIPEGELASESGGVRAVENPGFSETNRSPLAYGIVSLASDLVVDSNTFLGGGYGVLVNGANGTQVTHNVFDGFTLLNNGFGGAAIEDDGALSAENVIQFNTITSAVPPGDYLSLSWINEVDVPFAGIVISGQDGAVISNNKSSITSNAHGDAGVGILAYDIFGFPTINLEITNNDGRGPRRSPQKRPYVVTSKPANGPHPGHDLFYPFVVGSGKLFS